MSRTLFPSARASAWLLIGALPLFVLGCAKGKATQLPEPDQNYRFEFPTHNEAEAQALMALSRANCADMSDCPESVGMLVVATPHALGMCTAFLVAPDQVMTNSRCIREYVAEQKSCSGLIEIIFPETRYSHTERVGCAQVLYSSELDRLENAVSPEYALIHLTRKASRRALDISAQGISNEPLRVARVNPVATGSYSQGELEMVTCEPVYKPWVLPQADNAFSPVSIFAGCEMVGAHAGSPMIDNAGRVRAIIQARTPQTPDGAPSDTAQDKFENLSVAANLACLKAPGTDPTKLSPSCAADLSETKTAFLRGQLPDHARMQARAQVQLEANKWSARKDHFVQWNIKNLEDSQLLTLTPGCFHAANTHGNWLREYSSLGFYKKEAQRVFEIPGWEVQVGFNARQQVFFKISMIDLRDRAVFSFSPWQLHRSGKSRTQTRIESGNPPKVLLDESAELPFCSN